MAVKQIAFKNQNNAILIYKFDKVLSCSNGEIITKSANHYLAETQKGRNNLKVTKVTSRNWKAAARAHAKNLGYTDNVDTLKAERLDFDNPPQGCEQKPPMEIVQKIADYEKPFWLK